MQRVIRDGQFTVDKVDALSAKVALIQKHFPPTVASLYAIPRKGSGDVLEWWTELGGQPTPYAELNEDQQRRLLDLYQQRQDALGRLADELQNRNQPEGASLRTLIGPPELQDLYSLNGEPLVIRWGLRPPKPVPPPVVVPPVVPPSRNWWKIIAALLALLLLLLLLWAAYWFLCPQSHPVVPQPVAPAAVEPPITAPKPVAEPVVPEAVPEPAPEPVPEPVREPAPPPPPPKPAPAPTLDNYACRKQAPDAIPPQFVVVLDTSGSMNMNIKSVQADEEWFFGNQFNQYLDPLRAERIFTPPSRLSVATESLTSMIKGLDPKIDTRLITFNGCASQIDHGVFRAADRPRLINGIRGLGANDGTPLADSLAKAASTVDGRKNDAVIVMFVDGEDGCQKDVCAVSRKIAAQQPRLRVNVVNIGVGGPSRCIAENTGGRVYSSSDAAGLGKALKMASKEVSSSTKCN
ncbi:VWA domain-containing protein [Pseudomonas chlororaphis]|uniref:VWA domain-containing protein n=1 Tax=Pseudomonas chlororaphis TaxID=587753 RepID=UPI001B309927|nr:VWA domain-containing protein [Pseudomonas chlororaphis]QTT86185.1 VWA domain-containing protein [Pseudomonas chlororaphis]